MKHSNCELHITLVLIFHCWSLFFACWVFAAAFWCCQELCHWLLTLFTPLNKLLILSTFDISVMPSWETKTPLKPPYWVLWQPNTKNDQDHKSAQKPHQNSKGFIAAGTLEKWVQHCLKELKNLAGLLKKKKKKVTLHFETAASLPSVPLHHLQHNWCKLRTQAGIMCFITIRAKVCVCACHCRKPVGPVCAARQEVFSVSHPQGIPFAGAQRKRQRPCESRQKTKEGEGRARQWGGTAKWTWMWTCVMRHLCTNMLSHFFFFLKFWVSILRPASPERFVYLHGFYE